MNLSSLSTLFRTQSTTPVLAVLLLLSGPAYAQKTTRILGPGGVEPNGNMNTPFVSQDGSTVVLSAGATNLVSSDANGAINDIFAFDVASQSIELISKSTAGVQANAFSTAPVCSADGDRIVYWSTATNLDPADTSSDRDVFVHERSSGKTLLVSGGPTGFSSDDPFISPNGKWIVFLADGALLPGDTNGVTDVYRFEVATGDLTLVSLDESGTLGTAPCTGPISISNSGDRIVFDTAGALVAQDVNGVTDVYLRDVGSKKTLRVQGAVEPNAGASDPHISADGLFVSFTSTSTNFGQIDTNGAPDVLVWDIGAGAFSIISRGLGASQGNGSSYGARISQFGRYVVFASNATNLTADANGSVGTFWYDRQSGSMVMVNLATDGTPANGSSLSFPSVTQDGGIVAYQSSATNLVPGDTTIGWSEAMLGMRSSGATAFCTAKVNSLACVPSISASGDPSASQPQSFDVSATNVLNNKNGLFFYGLNGATALPFQGGTLCVFPPLKRTTIMNSQGSVGPDDCSGFYSFDFNAWLQGGDDVNLVVGREVNGQYWSRDPASSFGVGLTNAIRFVICP